MKLLLFFILTTCVITNINAQKEHYIKTADGVIHMKSFGQGKPILIINGGPGMNSEGFKFLAQFIGKSNTAIIYDQRGTGKSVIHKIDSSSITMDNMIEDIERIRKYFGFKNWAVLGHSFGGMLASYYASKFPHKINGLILSSSGGIDLQLLSRINITSRLTSNERDSLNFWNAKIANGDSSHYARLQRGKFLAPAYLFDKSNVMTIAERLTQGNIQINRLVFQNLRRIEYDCSKNLKDFEAPVLIIQGENDIIDKSISEYSHKVFKNSKLVTLKNCGHYGWLDQPKLYFKSIHDFLTESKSKP